MKKLIAILSIFVVLCAGLAFKSQKAAETIVIYTSTEDYNIELLQEKLKDKFPNYNIDIEYLSTSNIATKILEEGSRTECDIVFALDYAYIDKLIAADTLASFEGRYNLSVFAADTINESNRDFVLPTIRSGGGIIINKKVLEEKHIEIPSSYEDLLDPQFKQLISMPSPKSSGTGYMFYLSLVNSWGEEKALEYFDQLAKNVNGFTSSGSGPVNAISQNEVAVGLGMISQATEKITAGNDNIEILFFEEGAPYSLYGTSIVKGKETKPKVMEVMDFLYDYYINEACQTFYPELIFKGKNYVVENFPPNIKYSNMNNNTLERKENLLTKWSH